MSASAFSLGLGFSARLSEECASEPAWRWRRDKVLDTAGGTCASGEREAHLAETRVPLSLSADGKSHLA